MNRAEKRRAMRLVGWRGAKAKRHKIPDPRIVAAVRQAVKDRIAEQEAEQG